jgi:hypothetical protein
VRKALVLVLLVVLVVGPGAGRAEACSCAAGDDRWAFDRSDAVFAGDLLGTDLEGPLRSSADPEVFRFEVTAVYKGEVAREQEIVTEESGASCGLEAEVGGTYLVFASRRGGMVDPGDGQYYAGLCGGTRTVDAAPVPFDEQALPAPPPPVEDDGGSDSAPVAAWAAAAIGLVLGVLGVRRRWG